MGARKKPSAFLDILLVITLTWLVQLRASDGQLQWSDTQALLQIQSLLEYPQVLSGWRNWTDFCRMTPSSTLSIVCVNNTVTELVIVGDRGSASVTSKFQEFSVSTDSLSSEFSIDGLFNTISQLVSLKKLALVSLGIYGTIPTRISYLTSLETLNMSSNFIYGNIPRRVMSLTKLQTLDLNNNMFNGSVPRWMSSLTELSVLNLSNNALNGSLPDTLGTLTSLSELRLSNNNLSGVVPNLGAFTNLQVLDLRENLLGPDFPVIGNSLVSIQLQKNSFHSNLPAKLASMNRLEQFDVSSNRLVGPILLPLFSLPAIQYLNLRGNKLTGSLQTNMTCGSVLKFVDISDNLLSGALPHCLVGKDRTVSYSGNCLRNNSAQIQHQASFCSNEALAVIPTPIKQKGSSNKLVPLLVTAGSVLLFAIVLSILVIAVSKRVRARREENVYAKSMAGSSLAQSSPRLLLANSNHMPQTARLGAFGLPPYRIFTMEELEEATENFDESNLIDDQTEGQLYKGRLNDGLMVAVRCLKMKERLTSPILLNQIESLLKFRHQHVVSTLGHCISCQTDSSTVDMIFVVFEYVSNESLRKHISEVRKAEMLRWPQRVASAISIARGIQFLHMNGIFGSDIRIENVLLDQNLTAKLSKYNLPILSRSKATKVGSESPFHGPEQVYRPTRNDQTEKADVYRLGIIMLELIVGKPITSQDQLEMLKSQVLGSAMSDAERLRESIDPSIRYSCKYTSIRAAVEITVKCLSEDPSLRPSCEDVIWNLQYSAQVQDGSTTTSHVDDYPDYSM